jgi:hypothetical protein
MGRTSAKTKASSRAMHCPPPMWRAGMCGVADRHYPTPIALVDVDPSDGRDVDLLIMLQRDGPSRAANRTPAVVERSSRHLPKRADREDERASRGRLDRVEPLKLQPSFPPE